MIYSILRSVTARQIPACLFSLTTFFSEVRVAEKLQLHDFGFGLTHWRIEASKPDGIGAVVSVILSIANTPSAAW